MESVYHWKNSRYFLISLLVIGIDQCSKLVAVQYLPPEASAEIYFWLKLGVVHNTGAAFGLLSGMSGWQNHFFIITAVLASLMLVHWILRTREWARMVVLAFAIILGGAIGNLIDRIRLGAVIDFIEVHYLYWTFPVFNVADVAITIGAVIIVISMITEPLA